MREKLSDKVGKEITVFGLFGGIFPTFNNVRGDTSKTNENRRTLLLKDVVGVDGDYITDHLFIQLPKDFDIPKTLNPTNHVTVIGKVYQYKKLDKDYCNAKKIADYGIGIRKLYSGKVKKRAKSSEKNDKSIAVLEKIP